MKFTIDKRYNHIAFEWETWEDLCKVEDWCDDNVQYTVYATGIVYKSEQDLTMFLLRWA